MTRPPRNVGGVQAVARATALVRPAGTCPLIRQDEEMRHVSACLDPDTLGIEDPSGDGSHLEAFRSTA